MNFLVVQAISIREKDEKTFFMKDPFTCEINLDKVILRLNNTLYLENCIIDLDPSLNSNFYLDEFIKNNLRRTLDGL